MCILIRGDEINVLFDNFPTGGVTDEYEGISIETDVTSNL